MENLTNDNLFGRFFFKCYDVRSIEGYFTCINLLRPLLELEDFASSITGFYMNVSDNLLTEVRLSYFTNNRSITQEIVEKYIEKNTNIILIKSVKPHVKKISQGYGDEELRFRKYLHGYTQIGLDLLSFDKLYARMLVAEYRLTYSPQKISCRPLFEPAFSKHSDFYNQLDSSSKEQLWSDFDYWHLTDNPKYIADWNHMLVNMLLPGDWIHIFPDLFLRKEPGLPISGNLKERMLNYLNLKIPDDWSPD